MSFEQALANMDALAAEIRAPGRIVYVHHDDSDDHPEPVDPVADRWHFGIEVNGVRSDVGMPGLSLPYVRNSMFGAPRISIDGMTWMWTIAVELLKQRSMRRPADGDGEARQRHRED